MRNAKLIVQLQLGWRISIQTAQPDKEALGILKLQREVTGLRGPSARLELSLILIVLLYGTILMLFTWWS
ncbi:hypothetical protein K2173_020008 [Erythroxylum novogranatense]|uniref:Uncharacterized protein n=1 Tax=Erythroxylum novogranatense TaxID=1862640 RepID=A0AAV8UA85_9ROSI|nr:hypothetical protein K2173_020008 [Erythroxylum novogranatense]